MPGSDAWVAILAVSAVSVFANAAVAFACLRVVLRLAEQNRDLQKANLALSGRPAAQTLALAMEETDRAEANGVTQRTRDPARRMAQ